MMPKKVNFNRHLEKHWLDQVAILSSQKIDEIDVFENISRILEPSVRSKINRDKTRSQLMNIWFYKSGFDESWHASAFEYLNKVDHVPFILHWGMLITKNNFFADAVRFIGRKTKYNSQFTYGQIEKYISELYGDTETVKRSLRSVLKTLINFQIIHREQNGYYSSQKSKGIIEKKYKNWLLFGLMQSKGLNSRSVVDLVDDLVWFPFLFTLTVNEIDESLFELHQQGNDLILFKK